MLFLSRSLRANAKNGIKNPFRCFKRKGLLKNGIYWKRSFFSAEGKEKLRLSGWHLYRPLALCAE